MEVESRMSFHFFIFRMVLFFLFLFNYNDHVPSLYYLPLYVRGSLLHWRAVLKSLYYSMLNIPYNVISFRPDFINVLTGIQFWFRNVFWYQVTDTLSYRQCYNDMANTSIFLTCLQPESQVVTAPTGVPLQNSGTVSLRETSYHQEHVLTLFIVITFILLVSCFRYFKIRRRFPKFKRQVEQNEEKQSDGQPPPQKEKVRHKHERKEEERRKQEQRKQEVREKEERGKQEQRKQEVREKEGRGKQEQRKQEVREKEGRRKQEQRKQEVREKEGRGKQEEQRKREERREQKERRKQEEQRKQEEKRKTELLKSIEIVRNCKDLDHLKTYSTPKGLPNLGNTCYLNSLLQVLSWTPLLDLQLAEQLWKSLAHNEKDIEHVDLDNVPARLFLLLWNMHKQNDGRTALSSDLPYDVLQEARKLNDQFMGNRQQDSFEMYNTLIEGVEVHARLINIQPTDNTMKDTEILINKSPVLQLLGGTFVTVWYYESCEHVELTFQRFTSISVPVPQPQKVKTRSSKEDMYNNGRNRENEKQKLKEGTTDIAPSDGCKRNASPKADSLQDDTTRQTKAGHSNNRNDSSNGYNANTQTETGKMQAKPTRRSCEEKPLSDVLTCMVPSEIGEILQYRDQSTREDNFTKEMGGPYEHSTSERDIKQENQDEHTLNIKSENPMIDGQSGRRFSEESNMAKGNALSENDEVKETPANFVDDNSTGFNVDEQQPRPAILPHQPLEMMSENPTDLERGLYELTEEQEWEEHTIGCRNCDSSNSRVHGKTRMKLLIISLPPILVVHINRMEKDGYGGLRKVNRAVTYPKYLNMAPFCSSALQKVEVGNTSARVWFRLYGVVRHGGSIHGGHYTAFVRVTHQNASSLRDNFLLTEWRDPERVKDDIKTFWREWSDSSSKSPTKAPEDTADDIWYHISDSVCRTSDEKAATNDGNAYILMYERCG